MKHEKLIKEEKCNGELQPYPNADNLDMYKCTKCEQIVWKLTNCVAFPKTSFM